MASSAPLVHQHANDPDAIGPAYSRVRQASAALTQHLDPEDCLVQTIPEVSPTKWHLAHTTWFFEQFCLLPNLDSYRSFNDKHLYLFNSYYHTVGTMQARPERGLLNRPLLREVIEYRNHVDQAMATLASRAADDHDLAFRITLGLQHEQQHQELMLTDIKHVFFTNPLQPAYADWIDAVIDTEGQAPAPSQFVQQQGGRFQIGHDGSGFCFDNETPRHDVLVDEHALADRLVTNGEYREFIEARGYADPRLWLSDGWTQIRTAAWMRPLYWSEDLQREFTLRGWRDLNPAAPVSHISLYEADAYARWANARLPTEAELELAATDTVVAGNLLDSKRLHPAPAMQSEQGAIRQLWGDVWEWTASPYVAYPRFQPLAGSLGEYNGKFMANQVVVRGGSCATWADHLRPTYRSFFYPQDRWQFLGFRLARTMAAVA